MAARSLCSRLRILGRLKWLIIISVAMLSVVGLLAFHAWRNVPSRKVRRLLEAMVDIPDGAVILLYFGRSFDEVRAELDDMGPVAVPALTDALGDESTEIRRLAAAQLGRSDDPRAIEPLVRCIREEKYRPAPSIVVQLRAIKSLVEIRDPRAVNALMEWLSSSDTRYRAPAEKALKRIQDKQQAVP